MQRGDRERGVSVSERDVLGGEFAPRMRRRREKKRLEGSKSERAGGRDAVRQSGRPPGKQGRQAGNQAGSQAGKLAGSQCTSQDH